MNNRATLNDAEALIAEAKMIPGVEIATETEDGILGTSTTTVIKGEKAIGPFADWFQIFVTVRRPKPGSGRRTSVTLTTQVSYDWQNSKPGLWDAQYAIRQHAKRMSA